MSTNQRTHGLGFESVGFDVAANIVAARHRARNAAFLSTIGGSTPPLPLMAAASLTGHGALHVNEMVSPAPTNVALVASDLTVGPPILGNPHVSVASEPPRLFDYLVPLLLSEAKSEAILGDLNERFGRDRERFGNPRARRMYWGRALRSLWPLLRRAAARLIRWGIIAEGWHRLFS